MECINQGVRGIPPSPMPTLQIPNSACFHTLRNFLAMNSPFADMTPPATLKLHPKWVHMDPMALAMTAAWGGWCKRKGLSFEIENLGGTHASYAARMRLFHHLDIPYVARLEEKEEAGRFMPLTNVRDANDLNKVIGNVSALLHLDKEPNGLAAVRYCVSELVRNVLEHSGSPEGGFVCAQRYVGEVDRVSIAVADCGHGIAEHLSHSYPEALEDDAKALSLAMRPGITGAVTGMYGSPNNAGAGLFFTRAIAKATGGYFALISGDAAFRLKRNKKSPPSIFYDAFGDREASVYKLQDGGWIGTVASMEIVTKKIADFPRFFKTIRDQLPTQKTAAGKIKFT